MNGLHALTDTPQLVIIKANVNGSQQANMSPPLLPKGKPFDQPDAHTIYRTIPARRQKARALSYAECSD